jgi:MFS family permease
MTPTTPTPSPSAATLAAAAPAQVHAWPRAVVLLLNVAHAVDHMFLLIFAAAVAAIATQFGFSRWEDLMPYSVGAFLMFGLGSVPSGRLGDLWGRRVMMLIFFFGIGVAALLAALTQNAWQMALAMTLIGTFASIYHPVGIPMLVQYARNPGATIGVNGLAGNLGVAVAAVATGFLIKWIGWRAAFAIPGVLSIACGFAFAAACPRETEAPAKRTSKAKVRLTPAMLARAFMVMTAAAITGSLLFNFTTNGNSQLITERFRGIIEDPATLGVLLGVVYAIASLAQVVVGRLIDRMALKPLYFGITAMQIPLLILAAHAQGWWMFAALLAVMVFVFGAIPFTDAMVVRYVDDRLRSRVAGMRMGVSFGISSLAVYLLGPFVKGMGFDALLITMAAIAACTAVVVTFLPGENESTVEQPAAA